VVSFSVTSISTTGFSSLMCAPCVIPVAVCLVVVITVTVTKPVTLNGSSYFGASLAANPIADSDNGCGRSRTRSHILGPLA